MTRAIVAILLVVVVVPGCAGRMEPPILEGHSAGRFPLTIFIGRLDDDVECAVYRAIEDWNTVFRETFGPSMTAFAVGLSTRGVHVVISPLNRFYAPATARIATARPVFTGPSVESQFYASSAGLIHLPVHISVRQIASFEEANRETHYYRAFVRELGRALGLPSVDNPYSARRQLSEHYRQFWARHALEPRRARSSARAGADHRRVGPEVWTVGA